MAGRERPDVPDPDDWWSTSAGAAPPAGVRRGLAGEPDVPTLHRTRAVDPDDWLDDGPAETASRFRVPADARTLVVAVIAVIVVIIGLIASGVFAGGHPHAKTPITVPTTTVPSTPAAPTATVPPPPSGTLAPGATGLQVKALQRALAALGFSPAATDGSYGTATEQALKRVQRAHALMADGVLGPKTLAALALALRP